jgi:hypothetical protein
VKRDWWFVFTGRAGHPLARFCRDGFQHVGALTDFAGISFYIDPLSRCVEHQFTADRSVPECLQILRKRGATIVFLGWEPSSPRFNPVLSCASYLAYTAGIPFLGITPYSFYKQLLKLGGEQI